MEARGLDGDRDQGVVTPLLPSMLVASPSGGVHVTPLISKLC